jgi:glucose/arabinose dehydrogenase
MVVSPSGVIYVASYSFDGIDGKLKQMTSVWAIVDQNADGVPEQVLPVTEPLWVPNGIAFLNGDLYVALIDRVLRFRDIEANLSAPHAWEYAVPPGVLPTSTWHGWRYMRAGPDGRLYLAVGSPCNVPCDADCDCARSDLFPLYGTIVRFNADGSGLEVVARGLRNSVGMDFHPVTGDLWFTGASPPRPHRVCALALVWCCSVLQCTLF